MAKGKSSSFSRFLESLGFSRRNPQVRGKRRPLKLESLEDRCLLSALPADLSITKTDNFGGSSAGTVGSAVPGETIWYHIGVTNNGPNTATGFTIADTLPTFLTGQTLTFQNGAASVTIGGTSGKNIFGGFTFNLPAGQSTTFVASGTIPSTTTGQFSNTATVSVSSANTDPNPANNTATDVDKIVPQGNLSVAVTDSAGASSVTGTMGTSSPGASISYTLTVSNAGPNAVTGATLSDTFPAALSGLELVSATSSSSAASTVKPGPQQQYFRLRQGVIQPGGWNEYVFSGTFGQFAAGTSPAQTVYDTATVTAPSGFLDTNPNAVNNSTSATATDTLLPTTNLQITVSDNVGGSSVPSAAGTAAPTGTAIPGDSIVYTVVASNLGPGNVTGATVSAPIPIQLVALSLQSVVTSGGATSSDYDLPIHSFFDVFTDSVDLAAGSSIIYTLSGTIPSSVSWATGPQLSITATVTAPAGVIDSNPANTATDTDNLAPEADLTAAVTSSAGGSSATGAVGTPNPGDSVVYSVVFSNLGPSDVTGATVGDCFTNVSQVNGASGGAALQVSSVTVTPTANASGALPTSSFEGTPPPSGPNHWWLFSASVDMPSGTSLTYTFTAELASTLPTGPLTNAATINFPVWNTYNPASEVTSATVTDVVRPAADVQITMSDNLGGNSATGAIGNVLDLTPPAGDTSDVETVCYDITVSNNGPDATEATVGDQSPVPSEMITLNYATITATTGGATSPLDGETDVPIPSGGFSDDVDLPADSSITYLISATVGTSASGTTADDLTNIANVIGSPGATLYEDGTGQHGFVYNGVSATDSDALPADVVASESGQTTAVPGQDAIYQVNLTNNGPGAAQCTMLNLTLPTGVTLVGAYDSSGKSVTGITAGGGTHGYGIAIPNGWDGGSPGGSTSIILQVQVAPGVAAGTTLANSIAVSTCTAEAPVTSTNTATGTTSTTTISPVLSASFSTQVGEPGASLVPSITTPGAMDLVVTGSNCGIVHLVSHSNTYSVTVNGKSLGTFDPTGAIMIYGIGSAYEYVSPSVTLPAFLWGGCGTNSLYGGDGPDVIVGGPGGNTIVGGPGYNLLIGGGSSGGGQQTVIRAGTSSNNLEVAGSTPYDNNLLALDAIMTEWTNTADTIIQRVEAITAGVLPIVSIANRIPPDGAAAQIPIQLVALNASTIQGAANDYLYGSAGGDNLLLADPTVDYVTLGGTTGATDAFANTHNYIGKVTLIK